MRFATQTLICLAFLSVSISGCKGNAESENTSSESEYRTMTETALKLHKQCLNEKSSSACDAAIAEYDRIIPLLQKACKDGSSYACGLFPGFDQVPSIIRQYVASCVEYEPDPSAEPAMADAMEEAATAGCEAAARKSPEQ